MSLKESKIVTILILVETPLQLQLEKATHDLEKVTILILVETPLQYGLSKTVRSTETGHNPYFSGNSFAIKLIVTN